MKRALLSLFFICLPLVYCCYTIENIKITSLTSPELVNWEGETLSVVSGDTLEVSFLLNATKCPTSISTNFSSYLGNREIEFKSFTIERASLTTLKFTFTLPSQTEGVFTLRIRVGDIEKDVSLSLKRFPGDYYVYNYSLKDRNIVSEGENVTGLFRIYNFKNSPKLFIVRVNDNIVQRKTTALRKDDIFFSYTPKNGINTIKLCDENEICKEYYAYITVQPRPAETKNITPVTPKAKVQEKMWAWLIFAFLGVLVVGILIKMLS